MKTTSDCQNYFCKGQNYGNCWWFSLHIFDYSIWFSPWGFTLSKLWMWFIVPVFDLPTLSIMQAAGLCFLWSYFNSNNHSTLIDIKRKLVEEDNLSVSMGKSVTKTTIMTCLFLSFGWIIKQFLS